MSMMNDRFLVFFVKLKSFFKTSLISLTNMETKRRSEESTKFFTCAISPRIQFSLRNLFLLCRHKERFFLEKRNINPVWIVENLFAFSQISLEDLNVTNWVSPLCWIIRGIKLCICLNGSYFEITIRAWKSLEVPR